MKNFTVAAMLCALGLYGCGSENDEASNSTSTGAPSANNSTTGTGSAATGCRSDIFLDVTAFQGPGQEYAAPELSVTCSDTEMTVNSNGIPHYTYVSTTPNPLSPQNHTWTVPLTGTYSETPHAIPCLGTVGFSISGIPIYGPNEGPMPDPFGDPVENAVMDESQGHSAIL